MSSDASVPREYCDEGPSKWRSTRFLVSCMACGGMCVLYFQRVSLSLAIVCMVNHTALHRQQAAHQRMLNFSGDQEREANVSAISIDNRVDNLAYQTYANTSGEYLSTSQRDLDRCSSENDAAGGVPNSEEDGPFIWDKQTQGLLLAAIYVGYTVMQIPASYVVHRFGVRLTSGVSILVMSVCHILCHPAALLSPWAVLVLRIIMGVDTAFAFISMYAVWTKWAPRTEHGQLVGITFCGEMIACIAVFPSSALLCRYGFWGGWPSIFYTFGSLGIVWSVAWFILVRDSPETHPRISASERQFIVANRVDVSPYTGGKLAVPWGSILRSQCFWAILLAHFVSSWGLFLMISNLPIFLYETLHFDIQSNGVFSMLPYIGLFVVMSGSGFAFDAIIKRRLLSKLVVRKLATFLAFVVPACLLVFMSHLQCQQTVLVLVLLVVAVALTGLAITGGFFLSPYDVAPRYAVNICTVTNTIAAIAGVINPYMVAALTVDQTREQWMMVFYVTGGLYVSGCVVFCLLAKAHVQPWADPVLRDTECGKALNSTPLQLQNSV